MVKISRMNPPQLLKTFHIVSKVCDDLVIWSKRFRLDQDVTCLKKACMAKTTSLLHIWAGLSASMADETSSLL